MYGNKRRIHRPCRKPDALNQLENQAIQLDRLRTKYIAQIERQTPEFFEKNGGCPTCGGRGWIVVSDPLPEEKSNVVEYADCPETNCTPLSREKSGLDAGYTKYDRQNGIFNPCGINNPTYRIMVSPVDAMIRDIMSKIIEEKKWAK